MAQFVNMFEVDLDKRSYPVNLNQTVSEGNVSSNRIGAYVYKDGAAYNLGGNCTGMVMRADGSTVPLTGVIDGNAAYVILDQPSCAIPGPIQVAVNWVSGSNTTTLLVAYGTVIQTDTRDYVQPGTPIPDINELLAAIDNLEDATEAAESVLNGVICPLYIVSKGTKTALFELSSVEGSTSTSFVYTIRTIGSGSVYAMSDREIGSDYAQYTLTYQAGSNNQGTSRTSYKFDTTIVSEEFSQFAAFVCDRSDYKMKIISARELTSDHRVIALFWGRIPALFHSFTAFGNNGSLFTTAEGRHFDKIYLANINSGSRGALTWSKDANNVYTITRNMDNWGAFGIDERGGRQIGIGAPGVSGVDYPFPATVTSAAISGYACIVCKPENITESTWSIISMATLNDNLGRYLLLGIIYGNHALFFSKAAESLFTNYTDGETDDTWMTAKDAFWYSRIHNVITLTSGTVDYNSAAHTVTISNPIMAPGNIPGTFNADYKDDTFVVDFSSDAHPTWLKCIYFDEVAGSFISISSDTDSATKLQYRKRKNSLSMLCMVTNNKYVWTSNCQQGMWLKNGVDIYAGLGLPDLFKAFKKVGVVGDSLSVGYMMNKSTGVVTSRMLAYSWPKVVMRDAGGVPWLNLGTSGQNVLTWCSNATYGKVQAEASGNKCQAYIIGLGENDQSGTERGCPLGSPSDIVNNYQTVATTYYGGYARIIQILKHLNPDCKIFCLTNPRNGTGRQNYNEAVRYITNTYYANDSSIMLVDVANDTDVFNQGYLPADMAAITGGHYSAAGYARVASIMEAEISNAMEANVSSMYNIAYIPYDTTDPTDNTMIN